jgi:hypothetical protein
MRKNCNGGLPRMLFANRKRKKSNNGSACIFATIGFYHNETARRLLLTQTWSRMRVLKPDPKPWDLDQHMLDVNTLRDDDVLFNKCYGAFWTPNYLTDPNVGANKKQSIYMLCRKHDELEFNQAANIVMLMQLGAVFSLSKNGHTLQPLPPKSHLL